MSERSDTNNDYSVTDMSLRVRGSISCGLYCYPGTSCSFGNILRGAFSSVVGRCAQTLRPLSLRASVQRAFAPAANGFTRIPLISRSAAKTIHRIQPSHARRFVWFAWFVVKIRNAVNLEQEHAEAAEKGQRKLFPNPCSSVSIRGWIFIFTAVFSCDSCGSWLNFLSQFA